MKVLFDHQIFSMQNYGGISRYFANLYNGINAKDNHAAKLGLLFTNNVYVNKNDLQGDFLNSVIQKDSRRYKYNKWHCRRLVQQGNFDVFHPTYYHSYFLESLKKPFVITVHDMIHELYPQYFETDPYKAYKEKTVKRADHIIAISENTKRDIQRFYDIADDKITVIHHGYRMGESQFSPQKEYNGQPYLLFVGDRYGYKNFDVFLKAVTPVLHQHNIKLICAGGGAFTKDEAGLITTLKLNDRVEQRTVNDVLLKELYSAATAFVFPSLYEGFGLPILEAFANGCPVVMSNTSSLPEVGGDAAVYFDPNSEEAMTIAIDQGVTDVVLQSRLTSQGYERLKQFDMGKCVEQTMKVYNALIL